MHYTGMAAMRLEGDMLYSLPLVLVSVVVAVLLAAMSLHVHFSLSSADSTRRTGGWSRPAAALIMGGAVSGMHYTAMAAVHFFPSPDAPAVAHAGLDSAFLANVVMLVAGALTVLLIVATHELEIAGRRIAQAEIQQLNLALESRVEGRTRELATAYGALEARNREITLVAEMANALQTSQNLGEAASIIGHFCALAFPGSAGAAYLFTASRDGLEALAAWGEPRPASSIAASDCWALRRSRPHHAGDPSHNLRCVHARLPSALPESLCIPMNAQGNALGLLTLQSAPGEGCANKETLRPFAEAIADQLALVLANLQLRDTLRDQSIRDPLTGLYNRRFLEESLERELAAARRTQSSFAVLALDADHFKRYNDHFGHDAGDAVLRTLGQVLQGAVRAGDLACRFGGEEFTVVLQNVDAGRAFDWAERFAVRLREVDIHHDGKPLPPITMSIGVAIYPEHGCDASALQRAADSALYEAKRTGRDRVVIAGAPIREIAA
jgi:diguanylate cyclase (GGDEF)-like protein